MKFIKRYKDDVFKYERFIDKLEHDGFAEQRGSKDFEI